jgi:hypothetical protein
MQHGRYVGYLGSRGGRAEFLPAPAACSPTSPCGRHHRARPPPARDFGSALCPSGGGAPAGPDTGCLHQDPPAPGSKPHRCPHHPRIPPPRRDSPGRNTASRGEASSISNCPARNSTTSHGISRSFPRDSALPHAIHRPAALPSDDRCNDASVATRALLTRQEESLKPILTQIASRIEIQRSDTLPLTPRLRCRRSGPHLAVAATVTVDG